MCIIWLIIINHVWSLIVLLLIIIIINRLSNYIWSIIYSFIFFTFLRVAFSSEIFFINVIIFLLFSRFTFCYSYCAGVVPQMHELCHFGNRNSSFEIVPKTSNRIGFWRVSKPRNPENRRFIFCWKRFFRNEIITY